VIEVPLTEEDAPNVFISVVLIRGAQDSPQPVKMPDYKIGYCELTIDSHAKDLAIAVESEKKEVRPGDAASVSVRVKDANGKPVPNAEATLAAVDEGVLSLMSYETPKPSDFFHAAAPLAHSQSHELRHHFDRGCAGAAFVATRALSWAAAGWKTKATSPPAKLPRHGAVDGGGCHRRDG